MESKGQLDALKKRIKPAQKDEPEEKMNEPDPKPAPVVKFNTGIVHREYVKKKNNTLK